MKKSVRIGAAILPLILAATALGDGVMTDDGVYNGMALTAPEKANINAALTKLQNLANAETNAQNKATMQRVIDGLKDMLKNGQIFKEIGTSTDEAVTEMDGVCTSKGDQMNISAAALAGGEPACSNLADSLMHEGIHTIQWAMPGSPYAGTEEKEEWVAYSWGKYVLEKLLKDPNLTAAQKAALKKNLENDCGYKDKYCPAAAVQNATDAAKEAIKRANSFFNSNHRYGATYPASGSVEEFNSTDGQVLRTVATGSSLRSGLVVFPNLLGRDVIFTGGLDAGANLGVLVSFADTDGDGLVDQSSRVFQTLGGGAVPLVLKKSGTTLWVLASGPGNSPTRMLFYVPDMNGDGVPDASAAVLFASGVTMPALNSVRTFDVLSPTTVRGRDRESGMSILVSRQTNLTFIDSNGDHVADTVNSAPFETSMMPFTPHPLQSMVAGDLAVPVRCHPGSPVQIWHTDPLGNNVEASPIGNSPGASGFARTVSLSRPLNPNEFIVLREPAQGYFSPTPFQVGLPVPEILGINQAEVMPNQTVQLQTRFVDPTTVQVRCSGVPAPLGFATPTQVVFIVPPVGQYPSGQIEVELVQLSLTSNPVGLLINGDCNHNGVADLQDVNSGVSFDVNLDSVPDECQCMADFNRDGVVSVLDIFEFLNAWFAGDPTTRFNHGPVGSVQDIFQFLNVWFAGCSM